MSNSFLTAQSTSNFVNQITDLNSGANSSIGFWTAVPNSGYYYTGMYAVPNYNVPPQGFQWTFEANGNSDCFAAPTGFAQVWVCGGNGGTCWLGIYAPIAPAGYIALGCIASDNFYNNAPQIADFPNLVCVRQDLCTQITLTAENLIYTDSGTTCYDHVSVFMLPNSQTAYAVPNFPATVVAYDINLPSMMGK